ncbi:unnamed protein product [Calicophoron daubneyi]|uniref:Uncharacterized protein n=1 Tax=Calicophoron daubneyi TaxID=300641 RepID=A0AAV2TE00_CALDB
MANYDTLKSIYETGATAAEMRRLINDRCLLWGRFSSLCESMLNNVVHQMEIGQSISDPYTACRIVNIETHPQTTHHIITPESNNPSFTRTNITVFIIPNPRQIHSIPDTFSSFIHVSRKFHEFHHSEASHQICDLRIQYSSSHHEIVYYSSTNAEIYFSDSTTAGSYRFESDFSSEQVTREYLEFSLVIKT